MDKIIHLGNLRGNKPQGYTGGVYSADGISPAIRSRDYKDPLLVLEKVKDGRNRQYKEIRKQEQLL